MNTPLVQGQFGYQMTKGVGTNMPYLVNKETGDRNFVNKAQLGSMGGNVGGVGGQQIPGAGGVGGTDFGSLKTILTLAALSNPKNASKYSTIMSMVGELEPQEPSAYEQKKEEAKQVETKTERKLKELENLYLNNDLAKGSTGGIWTSIETIINPGGPYARYKSAVKSIRPRLARLAGDTGALAVQEQIAQEKLFPTARYTRSEAIQQFNMARRMLGLPERDFSNIGGSSITDFAGGYER